MTEPKVNPTLAKLLDGVYLGYLKSKFTRVYCPQCDKTGNPTLGLTLEFLTATTGRTYLYARCPVCNSYYNLDNWEILKAFQRQSRSGIRKPLIDERNKNLTSHTDRYKLE